jgi:hypothetical protein
MQPESVDKKGKERIEGSVEEGATRGTTTLVY